jgi:organic radical activating enzyme
MSCILNRIDLIVQNASKYAETVVVTGGEPLMWDMSLLTNKLKDVGRKVHIETSEHILYLELGIGFVFRRKKTNYQPRRCTMQP